jgi:hypothetical protein
LVSSLTPNASCAIAIRKNHTGALLFVKEKSIAYLGPKAPFFLSSASSSSLSSWSILAPLLGSLPWFLAWSVVSTLHNVASMGDGTYREGSVLLALGHLLGLGGRLLLALLLTLELVGNGALVLCPVSACCFWLGGSPIACERTGVVGLVRVLLALVEAVGLLLGLDLGVADGALQGVSQSNQDVSLVCWSVVPGHQPRRCCGIRRWKTC